MGVTTAGNLKLAEVGEATCSVTQLRVGSPLPQGPKEAALTLTTGSAEGGVLSWNGGRGEWRGRAGCPVGEGEGMG